MKEQDSLSFNAKLLCYKPICLTCLGKVDDISIGAVNLTACTYDLCVCAFSITFYAEFIVLCYVTKLVLLS